MAKIKSPTGMSKFDGIRSALMVLGDDAKIDAVAAKASETLGISVSARDVYTAKHRLKEKADAVPAVEVVAEPTAGSGGSAPAETLFGMEGSTAAVASVPATEPAANGDAPKKRRRRTTAAKTTTTNRKITGHADGNGKATITVKLTDGQVGPEVAPALTRLRDIAREFGGREPTKALLDLLAIEE